MSEPELTTVFTGNDQTQIEILKGLLNEANIPFVLKGEDMKALFGAAGAGSGVNPMIGPIEVQVAPPDVKDAMAIVAMLDSGEQELGPDSGEK